MPIKRKFLVGPAKGPVRILKLFVTVVKKVFSDYDKDSFEDLYYLIYFFPESSIYSY